MAYQESVVSSMGEIPELVATFAATAGWTVTGTAASPILTRPGGGLSFQLTDSVSGNDHILAWTQTGGSQATTNARVISPKLNGTSGSPVVSIPSKVHLFGDTEPEPFLVIVIEYGFNSYRHLYLGNMVKAGAYTGGEVISGAQPPASNSPFSYPMSYRFGQYLFKGQRDDVVPVANRGGVYCPHASNPTSWRRFYSAAWPFFNQNDSTYAIGGFLDDINDGYVARGRSPFAGVQILTPINLYASIPTTDDTVFAPLGHPAGVRMINMADMEPGAEFVIGSQTWMCFPAWAKNGQTVNRSAAGWGEAETSYHVGYAYPKD